MGHTLCLHGSEILVFGGGDNHTMFNDLAILDTKMLEVGRVRKSEKLIS